MAAEEPKPAEKRRLPMLQSAPEPPRDAAGEDRPAWRRVALGVTATFLVWLPLAALLPKPDAASGTDPVLAAVHMLAFCTGALAGGALAGGLGAERARREGALSGAGAAVVAWLAAVTQGAAGGAVLWGVMLVILATLGAGAGSAGGRLGERLRSRGK
jgi:hypothetical protein